MTEEAAVHKSGFVGIIGAPNAGKSTLLKSIAGIIPFEGDIQLGEVSLKKDPVLIRRKISFAEAEPFYPEMLTAREIIDFVASVREEPEEKKKELISYFDVDDFYTQACGGYSTGMLKKTALLLAFLGDPDLILLDEPFAFIDDETEGKLSRLINKLRKKGKNMIITSHHDILKAQISFDWIFIIRDHQLIRM
jgi:ABC-2 type transport system ATP-binding protein